MSTNEATYHLSDVLQYVKRSFGDEAGVQITDTDITAWTNQAQIAIAHATKCIQGRARSNLVAGTFAYDLPFGEAVEIVNLRINSVPVPGIEHGQAEQQLIDSDPFRTQTGPAQYWTKWGNTLEIYPTPTDSLTNGIDVFYIAVPVRVSNPADFLSLPDRYYTALLDYVMSEAYRLDEDYDAANQAYQNYQLKIGESLEEETQAQNLFYPTVTIVDWD